MTDKAELTVFERLRALNITKHVDKKNGFNYLSWAWAVEQMYMFDDSAEFTFPEREVFPDGSVMIYCDVTIKGKTKRGFLPVMDYKNAPIKNPNARQISDNMQRCLVKAIALHGLGLGLYAGEDLPKEPKKEEHSIMTDSQKKLYNDTIKDLAGCMTLEAVDIYIEKNKPLLAELPQHWKTKLWAEMSDIKSNIKAENANRNSDL